MLDTGLRNSIYVCLCDCDAITEVSAPNLRMRSRNRGNRALHPADPDRGLTYAKAHRLVQQARGRASTHPCVDCGAQALDWSFHGDDEACSDTSVTGVRYPPDVSSYSPRSRCHVAHDSAERAGRLPLLATVLAG
jgi:hypothetical protein